MGLGSIHLNVIVWGQIAFNDYAKEPKCVFLTHDFSESKNQVVHSLVVTNRIIAPNIGPEDSPNRLLNLISVKGIFGVCSVKIFVNLSEMSAWVLFELATAISMHQ